MTSQALFASLSLHPVMYSAWTCVLRSGAFHDDVVTYSITKQSEDLALNCISKAFLIYCRHRVSHSLIQASEVKYSTIHRQTRIHINHTPCL